MARTRLHGQQVKDGSIELIDLSQSLQNDLSQLQSDVSTLQSDVAAKPDTSSLAPVATSGSYNDLSDLPVLFSGDYADLSNKPVLFSGSYNDLSDKPTIPSALDDLSDVAVTSAVKGQFIVHDGSGFVNSNTIEASGAAVKPLVLKGAASQTANLFEIQNSSGTAFISVNANNGVSLKSSSATTTSLTITPGASSFAENNAYSLVINRNDGARALMVEAMGGALIFDKTNNRNANYMIDGAGPSIWNSNSGQLNFRAVAQKSIAFTTPNEGYGERSLTVYHGASIGDGFTTPKWYLNFNGNTSFITSGLGLNVPIGTALGGQFHIINGAAARKGIVVQGAASQTANLIELQNNSGTILFSVDKDGSMAAGTVPVARVSGLHAVATSGSYNDLSDKPTIPSISGLATESYVDSAVAAVVNSAPAVLDTLNELAAALGNDENFATTVAGQIGDVAADVSALDTRVTSAEGSISSLQTDVAAKADSASLATVATSGSYDDLLNLPTLFSGSYDDLSNKPSLVSSLDDLSDVTITSPSSDQVLKYDGTTWVNATAPATFSGSYNDLSDKPTLASFTTITSPSSGQYLQYTGSAWVNSGLPVANGSTEGIVSSGDQVFSGRKQLWGGASVRAPWVNQVALFVQPYSASQTANLLEIQNSSGLSLTTVRADGTLSVSTNTTTSGSAGISVSSFAANGSAPELNFYKSRNATIGSNTIVNAGDYLGGITFWGANGSSYNRGAIIAGAVDGTPGASGDMPGRIEFYTTADGNGDVVAERMRLNSAGNLGIGTTGNPGARLHVDLAGNGNIAVPGTKGILVRGAASQTANLFEAQNSAGTVLASISSAGAANFASSITAVGSISFGISGSGMSLSSSNSYNGVALGRGTSTGESGLALGSYVSCGSNAMVIGWGGGGTGRAIYGLSTGEVGIGTSTPGAQLHAVTKATTMKGLIVQGIASQTANLFEAQNSSGTALFSIDKDGSVAAGTVPVARVSGLHAVATSGSYNDLSDKPSLATVATSGDYADLSNTPTVYTPTKEVLTSLVDGTETEFVLAATPNAGAYVQVFLNGLLQSEGASEDYTISGATITFNSAPEAGWKLVVYYFV